MFLDIRLILTYVLVFVQVVDCHLVVDPRTRESRGFAFVTMCTVEEAYRCIKYLDRSVLGGRVITVEKVRFHGVLLFCRTSHRFFEFKPTCWKVGKVKVVVPVSCQIETMIILMECHRTRHCCFTVVNKF